MKKRRETCLEAIAKTSKETNKGGGGVKRTSTSAAHLNFHRQHIIRRNIAFFLNVTALAVSLPSSIPPPNSLSALLWICLRRSSALVRHLLGLPRRHSIGGTIYHDRRSFVLTDSNIDTTLVRIAGACSPADSPTAAGHRQAAFWAHCSTEGSTDTFLDEPQFRGDERCKDLPQRGFSCINGRTESSSGSSSGCQRVAVEMDKLLRRAAGLLLLLAHPNGEMAEYRFLLGNDFSSFGKKSGDSLIIGNFGFLI